MCFIGSLAFSRVSLITWVDRSISKGPALTRESCAKCPPKGKEATFNTSAKRSLLTIIHTKSDILENKKFIDPVRQKKKADQDRMKVVSKNFEGHREAHLLSATSSKVALQIVWKWTRIYLEWKRLKFGVGYFYNKPVLLSPIFKNTSPLCVFSVCYGWLIFGLHIPESFNHYRNKLDYF